MTDDRPRWGVFEEWDEFGARFLSCHVAPVDGEGNLEPGHTLDLSCNCFPGRDEDDPHIIVHREIN